MICVPVQTPYYVVRAYYPVIVMAPPNHGQNRMPAGAHGDYSSSMPGPMVANPWFRQQYRVSSNYVNFRHLPVFPTGEDLLIGNEAAGHQSRQVPRNIVDRPYGTSYQYLCTHFLLFREDFIRPLREAVQYYLSGQDTSAGGVKNMKVYEDVVVKTIWCSKGRLSFLVNFNADKVGPIDWLHSKRLKYGSLLCLTCDNFETVEFATVADSRPEMLAKGVLLLDMELEDRGQHLGSNELLDLKRWQGCSWTAVESPGYFLAIRHVLANLKTMHFDHYYLSRCILSFRGGSDPPAYFKNFLMSGKELKIPNRASQGYPFVAKRDVHGRLQWPPAELLGFDQAQYEAFKVGVTHELAVIQGPPGTGKTFLGLEIVQTLLLNRCWGNKSPILIICFTNHALDQFLERMLPFTNKLVRIGGRSQSEKLEHYKIVHWLRQKRYGDRDPRRRKKNFRCDHFSEVVKKLNRKKWELEETIQGQLLLQSILVSGAGVMKLQHLAHGQFPWSKPDGFSTLKWLGLTTEGQVDETFIAEVLHVEKANLKLFFGAGLDDSKSKNELLEKRPRWGAEVRGVIGRMAAGRDVGMAGRGNGFDEARGLVERRMEVEDWYDVDEFDDGNFNCYYEDRGVEASQKFLLDRWFEASVTQCHQSVNRFTSRIKDLVSFREAERQALERAERKASAGLLTSEEIEACQENFEANVAAGHEKMAKWQDFIVDAEETIPSLQSAIKLLRVPTELDFLPIPPRGIPNNSAELDSLCMRDRWLLYRCLVSVWLRNSRSKVGSLLPKFQKMKKELDAYKNKEAVVLLRDMDIVGMTTTGAARDIERLRELAPKIVVFEEAAEVFEAGIVTSLTESCEHLILIGDHQQLRPRPDVHELATKHKLDVSMFERLVMNGFPHVTLQTQHRMRPDIADLIRPQIYKTLLDSPEVKEYPPVKGMACNVFFVTHDFYESNMDEETKSAENKWEVDFILAFCEYLIESGVNPSRITILAPYSRQVTRFWQLQGNYPSIAYVKVTTVDNYQGEENDIILLSLVRNNARGDIGFLKSMNRVNVALSRAKHGLFMVGNMASLCKSGSEVWVPICEKLMEKGAIGMKLPIKPCHVHDDLVHIGDPEEFHGIPRPCQKNCGFILPCGRHVCAMKCHTNDPGHQAWEYRAHQDPTEFVRCPRKLHSLKVTCGQQIGECKNLCHGELPCRHFRDDIPCFLLASTGVDLDQIVTHGPQCTAPCSYLHKKCRHICARLCGHMLADAVVKGFVTDFWKENFALLRESVHDSLCEDCQPPAYPTSSKRS